MLRPYKVPASMSSRTRSTLAALSFLSALAVLPAAAQDDDRSACAAVAKWKPGPEAVASPADANLFKSETLGCTDYLYGINGQTKNFDLARRCLLTRGDFPQFLAMIFANGWGVRRDYDAATYFLCKAEEGVAPAEVTGMLEHLAGMRTAKAPEDLDYCAELTSGFGMSVCQQLDNDRAAPALEARIAAVEKTLDPAGKKALATLRKAADAFAEADSLRIAEVNRGGTIYPSVVSSATQEISTAFVATLENYAKTRAKTADPAAAKAADDRLNQAFGTARQAFEKCDYCQETEKIRHEELRDAQRAWIAYRDAWKTLYLARWKGAAPPESLDREIVTALSDARTQELLAIGKEEEGGRQSLETAAEPGAFDGISSGSGRSFRWKRRSIAVEATADSTGNGADSSGSDDRMQWIPRSLPVDRVVECSGAGPVSTASDGRMQ